MSERQRRTTNSPHRATGTAGSLILAGGIVFLILALDQARPRWLAAQGPRSLEPAAWGRLPRTSSSRRRWVIPKGIIDPGQTAGETALQEAWEEAGLTGVLKPEPLGSFLYEKYGGTCHVTVFLMTVTDAAEDWPERALRLGLSYCDSVASERILG